MGLRAYGYGLMGPYGLMGLWVYGIVWHLMGLWAYGSSLFPTLSVAQCTFSIVELFFDALRGLTNPLGLMWVVGVDVGQGC